MAIAYGSLCELETQYLLAVDLTYIKKNEKIEQLMAEVGSMLYKMFNSTSHPNSYVLTPNS